MTYHSHVTYNGVFSDLPHREILVKEGLRERCNFNQIAWFSIYTWCLKGAADEMVEKFRTAETTIIVKKDGDMWQYTMKSSLIPEKTIHFKSGEEVVTDLMGKGIKVI